MVFLRTKVIPCFWFYRFFIIGGEIYTCLVCSSYIVGYSCILVGIVCCIVVLNAELRYGNDTRETPSEVSVHYVMLGISAGS